MKPLPVFFVRLLAGCAANTPTDILTRPVIHWTRLERDAIITQTMVHNIFDLKADIRIFATPNYPSTEAISCARM
ncbi:MAG: hypothetical protein HYR76_11305 [Ignavibacteria bacterium]|nr:hypothetical protein [Ignavibacteria bacterium]MBI3765972.1 hypothetical protein [Ignavibacteriales bacterium]